MAAAVVSPGGINVREQNAHPTNIVGAEASGQADQIDLENETSEITQQIKSVAAVLAIPERDVLKHLRCLGWGHKQTFGQSKVKKCSMENASAASNYETDMQHDMGSKIQINEDIPEASEICKAGATPGNLGHDRQSPHVGEPSGQQDGVGSSPGNLGNIKQSRRLGEPLGKQE
eukprot:11389871-Karenia_brevis.AAC.1